MSSDHSRSARRADSTLIGDVQRFGSLSAATVIDRYAGMVDRVIAEGRVGPAFLPDDDGALVDRAARLAEAYLRLVDATAALASGAGPREVGPSMERITLPAARSGSTSEASLWIHNPTGEAATRLDLEVTDLVSPVGLTIPAAAASVSPPGVDRLDPSASRRLLLRVDVPEDQPPGYYHGLVLIAEPPDESIGLRLEVRRPAEDRP